MKIKYKFKDLYLKPKLGDYIYLKHLNKVRKVIGFMKEGNQTIPWLILEGEYMSGSRTDLNAFNPDHKFVRIATPEEIKKFEDENKL